MLCFIFYMLYLFPYPQLLLSPPPAAEYDEPVFCLKCCCRREICIKSWKSERGDLSGAVLQSAIILSLFLIMLVEKHQIS